jgi:hypothetical protein
MAARIWGVGRVTVSERRSMNEDNVLPFSGWLIPMKEAFISKNVFTEFSNKTFRATQ